MLEKLQRILMLWNGIPFTPKLLLLCMKSWMIGIQDQHNTVIWGLVLLWGCLSWFEWSMREDPDSLLGKKKVFPFESITFSFMPFLFVKGHLLLPCKILPSCNLHNPSFKSNNYHQQHSSSLIASFILTCFSIGLMENKR